MKNTGARTRESRLSRGSRRTEWAEISLHSRVANPRGRRFVVLKIPLSTSNTKQEGRPFLCYRFTFPFLVHGIKFVCLSLLLEKLMRYQSLINTGSSIEDHNTTTCQKKNVIVKVVLPASLIETLTCNHLVSLASMRLQ